MEVHLINTPVSNTAYRMSVLVDDIIICTAKATTRSNRGADETRNELVFIISDNLNGLTGNRLSEAGTRNIHSTLNQAISEIEQGNDIWDTYADAISGYTKEF